MPQEAIAINQHLSTFLGEQGVKSTRKANVSLHLFCCEVHRVGDSITASVLVYGDDVSGDGFVDDRVALVENDEEKIETTVCVCACVCICGPCI